MLPPNSSQKWDMFLRMSDADQRATINDKPQGEEYIRLFFEIVKKVKGDPKLVTFSLLLIDGILEDNRSRINYLLAIQRSHKKDKKEDLIDVLQSFLTHNTAQENDQRDLASHILAMLIEAHEYKNCQQHARSFLNWLLEQRNQLRLSL